MRVKTARTPFIMQRVCSVFSRWHSKASFEQAKIQKLLAILMLSIIGGFYAAPLVQAASNDPDSSLPACCRRHGKHHCAMMDRYLKSINSGTPQIRTTPQHCPFYPHTKTVSAVSSHAGLAPSAAIFAQAVSHPAVRPQTHAVYRLSLDRCRQKRGPPTRFLCA
jgi:hypothetical protein